MTDEKRFSRSQKFNISDQMWSIQAGEQGLTAGDIFCSDPDRADPEPMVRDWLLERRGKREKATDARGELEVGRG